MGVASRNNLVALVLVAVAVFWVLLFAGTPYDDAFIYFRYARNLATGHGAVFNPGEYVEGYSGVAWMLLQTVGAILRAPPAIFAALLSLVAYVGIVSLLVYEGRARLGTGPLSLLPAALYVVYAPNAMWAVSGLETTFQTFLILAALVCYRRRRLGLTAALLFLVAFNRVEGIALYALFIGHEALFSFRTKEGRRDVLTLALGLLPFIVFLLCRRFYYGDWLPNTYYVKVGFGVGQLGRGIDNTMEFIDSSFGCFLFFVLALAHGLLFSRRDPVWRLSALLLLGGIFLNCVGGGNNLAGWRYLNPYHPLAALIVADFLAGARGKDLLSRGAAAGIAGLIFFSGVTFALSNPHVLRLIESNRHFHRCSKVAGELFREVLEPSQSIALNAIPFMSYYYGGPVIDMLGLVDRHIAHRKLPMGMGRPHGHEKGDGKYVLERSPTFIILSGGPGLSNRPETGYPVADETMYVSDLEILSEPGFRLKYKPHSFQLGPSFINVYRARASELRVVDLEQFWRKWHGTIEEGGPFESWLGRAQSWGASLPDSWVGLLLENFRSLRPRWRSA